MGVCGNDIGVAKSGIYCSFTEGDLALDVTLFIIQRLR